MRRIIEMFERLVSCNVIKMQKHKKHKLKFNFGISSMSHVHSYASLYEIRTPVV